MKNVLNYLENSAIKFPKKKAVIESDCSIDYTELLNYAKSIGSFLADYNVERKPVAVFLDKGIDALITFLGITYAGGFYSLINPEFPSSRLKSMFETLDADIIVARPEYMEVLTNVISKEKIVLVDDIKNHEIDNRRLDDIRNKMIDLDPLYLNFTSGSTGIPKGVLINHHSVIDFIDNFVDNFNINENDIIANQAPFDFDVSIKDIYSSLKVGATLLIVPKPLFSSPAKLLDYLCDNNATTMIWAVSALCLITTFHGLDYKVPSSVNKVIFSGEVMPIKHLNIWMEKLPNSTFVNVYGPTEITCNCTYHIIDRDRDYQDKIPIGGNFNNERVILLDDNDQEVKDGIGEICVSGRCLALGYYNNLEETNKRFVQNPLNKKYPELIYRTGDLGEYRNGELYFMGRKDFQIKYMGHRIELEEIEKAIMNVDGVVRTCCLFDEEKERIYGFYIGDIDKKDLYNKLKEDLPIYMIPTKLISIEEFPLTKNGKIDRKVLKGMV